MNRTGLVIFVLGLFIAIISGVGVFFLLLLNQPKPADAPSTKLVIAFQDIHSETEITLEQVGTTSWPKAVPTPNGAFTDTTDVIGKFALSPIFQGAPVVKSNVADKAQLKENHSNASLILEKGSVAIAVPITSRTNVADAVQAGDRVDLLATFHSESLTNSGQIATQRVLADMLVLQVGSWPLPGQKPSGTPTPNAGSLLTLQLTEQEALVLDYAMNHADLVTFVLRSANDHAVPTVEPVTFDYINQRYGFKLPR